MIRPGFLDPESRQDLIELARDGSAAHRLARRANALVLLDDGMSFTAIAKVLLIDDDTIRTWYALYQVLSQISQVAAIGSSGWDCFMPLANRTPAPDAIFLSSATGPSESWQLLTPPRVAAPRFV